MFRKKTAVVMAAALALTLAGCTGGDGQGGGSSDSGRGSEVSLVTVAAPGSLDPAAASMGPTAPYFEAVYDTLLRMDASGEIQPWLATEWTYNDDRTQLTLALRDDVTFTDGSELTAETVVANLERFKAGTAPTASRLAGVTSIEATDDTTVVITLALPDPNFLIYLTVEAGLIASGEALDDPDLATDPVGSGAYVLDTEGTVIGSTYRFTANPDYWNPDVQHFDQITINAFQDPSAVVNAISAGEADVVQMPKEARQPAEAANWTIDEIYPGGFAGIMLFDRNGAVSEPLSHVEVRQAINYALDRPALISALQAGVGEPTTQVFPRNGAAYDTALDDRYPHDPEKAKALLTEAGYPDGITLTLPDFGNRDNYAIMVQMLAESNISVEWIESQLQNSIADILGQKFSSVYFSLGEVTDWGTVQQIIAPNAGFNPFKTQDAELDALISEMQVGDDAQQAEAATAINEYIVEQAWFAPIQGSFSLVGSSPDVSVTPPTMTTYPSIFDITPAN